MIMMRLHVVLALTLGFVAMRLTGAVNWSWWMVSSPIWGALCGLAYGAFERMVFGDEPARQPNEPRGEDPSVRKRGRDEKVLSSGPDRSLGHTIHLTIMQYFARERIGFSEALALVFITLRLTGHISWSWWIVLLPLYIWLVLIVALEVFMKALANIMIWREQRAG